MTKDEQRTFNKNTQIVNDLLVHPATGRLMKMTRKNLRQLMLNMGNASNWKKTAEGWGWKPEDMKTVVDRNATKADWDYVQNEWNIHEKHWPELEALERRTHGWAPDKIKAQPIDTPFGRYEGGYYPIVYDFRNTKEVREQVKDVQNGRRPSTTSGASKNRIENYSDRVSLNEDAGLKELDKTMHDIYMREPVKNMSKILYDKGFKDSFVDTFGAAAYKSLDKWLNDVATQGRYDERLAGFANFMQKSTSNFAAAEIGFNVLSTLPKHTIGAIANIPAYVGAKHASSALGDIARNPTESYKWADDKFDELGLRRHSIDRDWQDVNKKIGEGLGARIERNFINYSHAAISEADYFTAVWAATAAYKKAITEGKPETEAVRLGNKAVRETHGTSNIMDRSAIERNPYLKPFTMFYGFFNRSYQNLADTYDQAKLAAYNLKEGKISGEKARQEFASVLGRSMAYLLVVGAAEQMVGNLVSGNDKDKDRSWLGSVANDIGSQAAATIPFVRDLYNYWEGRSRDVAVTPLSEELTTPAQAVKEVFEGKPNDEHLIKSTAYVTGKPIVKPYNYGKYLWHYTMGDEDPQSFGEFVHGMSSGHGKK